MDKLKEKLSKNFKDYTENMLSKSKKEIFENSYETAIKYEFSEFLEFSITSEELQEELLSIDNPLEYLWEAYVNDDNANIIFELETVMENLNDLQYELKNSFGGREWNF